MAVSKRRADTQAVDASQDLWHAGDGMLACPVRVHVLGVPC